MNSIGFGIECRECLAEYVKQEIEGAFALKSFAYCVSQCPVFKHFEYEATYLLLIDLLSALRELWEGNKDEIQHFLNLSPHPILYIILQSTNAVRVDFGVQVSKPGLFNEINDAIK